jgi:hypothetical protein
MKKQNKIPESWSLCWSLLAVQRSVGVGNKARTFTSLTTLAKAAGCGTHVPRAFAALGYIRRAENRRWIIDRRYSGPDWDEVRAWIALQPGRAVKKTPPTPTLRQDRAGEKQYTKAEVIAAFKKFYIREYDKMDDRAYTMAGFLLTALDDVL